MDLNTSSKTIICPVCKTNSCLEELLNNITSWLCIKCGYTSNSLFVEGSQEFATTPKAIMNSKFFDNERQIYWIPTVINMPSRGMIFPEKYGQKIIWSFVPMIDIPINEQRNYPIANQEGKFYTRKLDADKAERYSEFSDALKAMGAIIKLDNTKKY